MKTQFAIACGFFLIGAYFLMTLLNLNWDGLMAALRGL